VAGAVAATKLNKRVALVRIDRGNSATNQIGSRRLILQAVGQALREVEVNRPLDFLYDLQRQQSHCAYRQTCRQVRRTLDFECEFQQLELEHYGIDVYEGTAAFESPHEIVVQTGRGLVQVFSERYLIATGARADLPAAIEIDGRRIIDVCDILTFDCVPRRLIVVGGGRVGMQCGIFFATFGVLVTIIDGSRDLERFDSANAGAHLQHCLSLGMEFELGADAIACIHQSDDNVDVQLETGRILTGSTVLWAAGSKGNTDGLNLEAAGIEPDDRGRIWCDENFCTWVPNVYAVGDVVGFPRAAGQSAHQGPRAVCNVYGRNWGFAPPSECAYSIDPERLALGLA
jgi:NAD(P) transhydrogenase